MRYLWVLGLTLCFMRAVAAQEPPKQVTLTVETFPASRVYMDTVRGPTFLGKSSEPLVIEPPCMLDASGKRTQYGSGSLILRAPGHADYSLAIPSQDWGKGHLPVGGRYRLSPNNVWITLQDYFLAYPWLLALAALPVAVVAYLWRKRGHSRPGTNQPLETEGDPMLGRQLGAYRVHSRLGQGGMGSVYRVVGEDQGEYAAKVVFFDNDQELKRFRREFKVIQSLRHPGLVKAFDYGEKDGLAFCIMELVKGQTLSQYVRPEGLPWSTIWPWAEGILDALAFAHAQGVVHRDLKPGNIMVCDDQQIKILDFGLARQAQLTAVTLTGQGFGTPTYVAPEQISASGTDVDPRADIYSLGIVFYELLAGHPPFVGEDLLNVLAQHVQAPPPPISKVVPSVPWGMDEILLTMMAKRPVNRYANVEQVKKALADLKFAPPSERPVASTAPCDEEGTVGFSGPPAEPPQLTP